MSALYRLLWASLVIINAQTEQMFYYYDLSQLSDWTKNVGTYNPSVHTYTPVEYVSNSPRCPRAGAGGTSVAAKNCVRTVRDASISRVISTTGYQSIRLQVDVRAKDVEVHENDWCVIQYRTATTNWVNVNVVQGEDAYKLNYNVYIPDTNVFNNQQSFEVKLGIVADAGGDNCFFDNFKVFGTVYTTTTTKQPTKKPTNKPTNQPTKKPSIPPTKKPTNQPTKEPTNQPTKKPTSPPTQKPTNKPIATQISLSPTQKPTGPPTQKQTNIPTKKPTKAPTLLGTMTCGDHDSGRYNGEVITFLVRMSYQGDLSFDASNSNFQVTDMEATTQLGSLLATDYDGDQVVDLFNIPTAYYKFLIYGGTQTDLTYDIRITCATNDLTLAPTAKPSFHLSHTPTSFPTALSMVTTRKSDTAEDISTNDKILQQFFNLPIYMLISLGTLGAVICCCCLLCCCLFILCRHQKRYKKSMVPVIEISSPKKHTDFSTVPNLLQLPPMPTVPSYHTDISNALYMIGGEGANPTMIQTKMTMSFTNSVKGATTHAPHTISVPQQGEVGGYSLTENAVPNILPVPDEDEDEYEYYEEEYEDENVDAMWGDNYRTKSQDAFDDKVTINAAAAYAHQPDSNQDHQTHGFIAWQNQNDSYH